MSACLKARSQGTHDTSIAVYFKEDSFRPDSFQLKRLDSFISFRNNIQVIGLEGHTDTIASSAYNQKLSGRRSGAIARYLYAHWGFLMTDYPIQNFGEERPLSPADDSLNRCVVIRAQWTEPAIAFRKVDTPALRGRADSPVAAVPDTVILKKFQLDKLFFKPNLAVLESFSLSYIHSMALTLKKYQQGMFEIRGHVNCPLSVKPGSGFMLKMNELAVARARLVYELLIGEGVPASRMSYRGLGNTEMLYPDATTEEEMRKNMRVEIFVTQISSSQPSQQ